MIPTTPGLPNTIQPSHHLAESELDTLSEGQGKVFQSVGAMAEKAMILGPTNQNSLTKGIHNISSFRDQLGQNNVTGTRQFLR